MKTITILLLSVFFVISCNISEKRSVATLRGKVISGDIKQIEFTLFNRPPQVKGDSYVAEVDSSSNFSIEIPIERLRHGRFYLGSTHELCLLPNDDIYLSIEGDTVTFSGEGAEENNFLYKAKVKGLSTEAYHLDLGKAETLPYDFPKILDKFRESRSNFLKTYPKKDKLKKEFINFYEINNQVTYERQVVKYPGYYARRKKISPDSMQLPDEYIRLSQFSNIVDDSKIISRNYISSIQTLIWDKVSNILEIDTTNNWEKAHFIVITDSLSGITQEYILANQICQTFTYRGRYDTLAIKAFKSLNTDEYSTRAVNNAIKKHVEKQSLLGEPMHPEFANTLLLDTANRVLSFADVMKKNLGKVVYLDIWSTWCGPCIAEMPLSKKLREKLEGKPIEFVYVSVEKSDSKNWERVFEMTFMKKNQFVFKNEFRAKMLDFMGINGVPTYMIFDKKGRLVDFKANRPSNPDTEKRLIELANE